MSNNSLFSGIHSTIDNNIETEHIEYTVFHQDTNLEFVDVKKLLNLFYSPLLVGNFIDKKAIQRN